VFTIPAGIASILAVGYLFSKLLSNFVDFISNKITAYQAVGFHFNSQVSNFDPFFFNTQSFLFITVFLYSLVFFSILMGHKMATGRWGFSLSMIYFVFIFSIVAPFWLMKAVYATVVSRKPAWR
jgi:hypothetical protein